MSLEDVITQVEGGKPTLEGNSTDNESSSDGTSESTQSITLGVNGQQRSFDLLELILYGVVVADLLLLYVAIRV